MTDDCQSNPDPAEFLSECTAVRLRTAEERSLATRLAGRNELDTVQRCFQFVRDEIAHSSDHKRNPVTCTASEVLSHGTGFCYAKSHLLCALLRFHGVPAGMCYQRLSIDGKGPPYCLHGLNAVYLRQHGWYRLDARGNRGDIDAQFTPPTEQLAFATEIPGEFDLPEIYRSPLPVVLKSLTTHQSWDELAANLPDTPAQ